MGFGKVAMMFVIISLFAFMMVGMAAMMQRDMPTDSYYKYTNQSANGTTRLATIIQGQTASLMVPVLAIAGILLLAAGFGILRKG